MDITRINGTQRSITTLEEAFDVLDEVTTMDEAHLIKGRHKDNAIVLYNGEIVPHQFRYKVSNAPSELSEFFSSLFNPFLDKHEYVSHVNIQNNVLDMVLHFNEGSYKKVAKILEGQSDSMHKVKATYYCLD